MSTESVSAGQEGNNSKRRFEFPHVFVILFGLIVLMALLTYVIPAGKFDRVTLEDGQEIVVDGTYHSVDAKPTGFIGIFKAVHKGMEESAKIIFFIFIVGGAFGILAKTRAIEVGLSTVAKKMSGKEMLIIPVIMTLFALGGATFGMAEETIPFVLILVPLALKLGFDSFVGVAMVLVGVYAGFSAAFLNPFTIGVAQDIAEVPLFSGMGFRIVIWIVYVSITIGYVMLYAHKVKKNPRSSAMYEFDQTRTFDEEQIEDEQLSTRQSVIIAVLGLTVV